MKKRSQRTDTVTAQGWWSAFILLAPMTLVLGIGGALIPNGETLLGLTVVTWAAAGTAAVMTLKCLLHD